MKSVMSQIIPAIFISLAGGLLAVLHKCRQAKDKIKLLDIVYQIAAAIFTGFLVHCLCCQFQTTAPGTGFYMMAVAIAGYSSRPILTMIKDTLMNKMRLLTDSRKANDDSTK